MNRDLLSPAAILDDIPPAVARVASPWLGVFWLLLLPFRFLQIHFFQEAYALGPRATHYGIHLGGLALATLLAFLLALYGRAVFVRACLLGLQSGTRVENEAWRVRPLHLFSYLYTALLLETLFFLSIWTYLTLPILVFLSGLAAVTAHRVERPGLFQPIREMLPLLEHGKIIVTLLVVFTLGLFLATVNLYFAFQVGIALVGGLTGSDLTLWEHLFRPIDAVPILPKENLPRWICFGGALLALEPFWLAALSVFVHRAQLRETGEDLRLWFERLQQKT